MHVDRAHFAVMFCRMMRLTPSPTPGDDVYPPPPTSRKMFWIMLSLIVTLRVSPRRLTFLSERMAEILTFWTFCSSRSETPFASK